MLQGVAARLCLGVRRPFLPVRGYSTGSARCVRFAFFCSRLLVQEHRAVNAAKARTSLS